MESKPIFRHKSIKITAFRRYFISGHFRFSLSPTFLCKHRRLFSDNISGGRGKCRESGLAYSGYGQPAARILVFLGKPETNA